MIQREIYYELREFPYKNNLFPYLSLWNVLHLIA